MAIAKSGLDSYRVALALLVEVLGFLVATSVLMMIIMTGEVKACVCVFALTTSEPARAYFNFAQFSSNHSAINRHGTIESSTRSIIHYTTEIPRFQRA